MTYFKEFLLIILRLGTLCVYFIGVSISIHYVKNHHIATTIVSLLFGFTMASNHYLLYQHKILSKARIENERLIGNDYNG